MAENLSNGAQTTLNGAMDNSQTTGTLTSSSGWPSAPFRALITHEGSNVDEIIYVGARSGTSLSSITRAAEAIADGTQVAVAHASGATITQVLTVTGLRDLSLATGTIGAKAVWSSGSLGTAVSGYARVPFNGTDIFDTDGFHDPSTNNSRITIPAGLAGKYLAIGSFYSGTNELAYGTFIVNGVIVSPPTYAVSGDDIILTVTNVLDLSGGDYVELGINATTGNTISAANLIIIKLDSGRVGQGVGARVYNSTTQAITNSTEAPATFDTEDYDTDGFHSTVTNTSRMTIPAGMGGKYVLTAGGEWSAGGGVYGWFRLNGSTAYPARVYSTGAFPFQATNTVSLVAGDYVEFVVDSVNSGNFGHASATKAKAFFTIMRLDSNSSGVLASGKVHLTSGDVTTTSDTFVDATGLVVALTTGARRCLVTFSGNINNSTSTSYVALDFAIDGTRIAASSDYGLVLEGGVNANTYHNGAFSVLTDVLSAGAHTFQMKFRRGTSGTAKIIASTAENPAIFSVQELPDSGTMVYSGNGVLAGAAFPTAPSTGDRYYRSDRNLEYVYNGTYWLTTTQYTVYIPISATSSVSAAVTYFGPIDQTYSTYIEKIDALFYSSGLTSGAYWTLTLNKETAPEVSTSMGSCNIQSGTNANWLPRIITVNDVVVPATYPLLNFTFAKVGSPGASYCSVQMTYRLVG